MLSAVVNHVVGPGPTAPATVHLEGLPKGGTTIWQYALPALAALLGVALTIWMQAHLAKKDRKERRLAEQKRYDEESLLAARAIYGELIEDRSWAKNMRDETDEMAAPGFDLPGFSLQWREYSNRLAVIDVEAWKACTIAQGPLGILAHNIRNYSEIPGPLRKGSKLQVQAQAADALAVVETALLSLAKTADMAPITRTQAIGTKNYPVPKPDEKDGQ